MAAMVPLFESHSSFYKLLLASHTPLKLLMTAKHTETRNGIHNFNPSDRFCTTLSVHTIAITFVFHYNLSHHLNTKSLSHHVCILRCSRDERWFARRLEIATVLTSNETCALIIGGVGKEPRVKASHR